ncbi:MAG: hypothetical protein OXP68_13880 [Anaerolineaceae bacterium]|nr:hypothetical protein [Anaerolineaceae bacterium]MDE0327937.1 hypothetical protein [Anaerolineaceae bacterium]
MSVPTPAAHAKPDRFADLTWRWFHRRDAVHRHRLQQNVHRATNDWERRSAMLELREWQRDAASRCENHVMLLATVRRLSKFQLARDIAWTELCRS